GGSSSTLRRYNVSAITHQNTVLHSNGCQGPSWAQYPNRYSQLATATDGIADGDICDTQFATSLDKIQSKIAELSTQFVLNRVPDVSTIVIAVNGVGIPQNASNGWTYNSTNNSIVFHGTAIPPQNASISVNFVPTSIKN